MPAVSDSKYLVMAGWDDVPHLSDKAKKELLDSTPLHLRDARSKGIPVLGDGAIYPVDESLITESAFKIPKHWPRICGMDFGWDHPTAAAWIAWDRDADAIHLYDVYRQAKQLPAVHSAAMKAKGQWIPVAWPHDGYQHEKGTGTQLASQYRDNQLKMLADHAQFLETPEDNNYSTKTSVEAGIMMILEMMQTGRFLVAEHLQAFFEEFRLYHRKDGKIVKVVDDILDAVRYALMMLRFAITEPKATMFKAARDKSRGTWKTA